MGEELKDMTSVATGVKDEAQPDKNSDDGSCCSLADKLPARYILAVLFLFGQIAMIPTRVGFNFAIVVMVNSSSRVTPVNQTDHLCPSSGPGNTSAENDQGELNWSESMKGLLLGASFYGLLLTQVVGGVLEQKLGGKIVYGTGAIVSAALNALGPVAARASPWAMFAVRFLMGLVSGVQAPTMYGLWGRWAPPFERSRLLAISLIGLPLGNVINYPLASFLTEKLGWPFVFYIPGIFVAVWLVAWVLLAYDSPAKHPRILEEERKYIEDGIGMKKQQKPKVPWLKVLTSLPVWALIVGTISANWGVFILITQLPNYMQNVLGFNIRTNGLLSALPFVVSMVFMLTSGFVADHMIKGGKIPKVWIRRGFVLVGYAGTTISGVVLANVQGCDRVTAVAMLCLTQAFGALSVAGVRAVHVEFAPRFSGVTFALANMGGTLSGILAPLLVGLITDNYPTVTAWSMIFYIGAGIQGFGGIFTAVFLSTDVQPWAQGKGKEGPNIDCKNTEVADPKDLVIANEYAEMSTKTVEMFTTKL